MPHRRSSTNVIARLEDLRPFTSKDEVTRYLDSEKLECLICGKHYIHLGRHLIMKHGIGARAYKVKLNLPLFCRGLIGTSFREKMSQTMRKKGVFASKEEMRDIAVIGRSKMPHQAVYRGFVASNIATTILRTINKRANLRSRKMLIDVFRHCDPGLSQREICRRAGVSNGAVRWALNSNLDMKAAFHELMRPSHAQ